MSRPHPFLLHPAAKDYIWGGTRLKDDFSKDAASDVLAETWECSTHPDGVSIAASGEWIGMPLDEILRAHPEYLGEHAHGSTDLPVLVKLIDAKRDLSVQVHPSDEFAHEREHGQNGKTEMWYVMDAEPDTRIAYGLHHTIGKDQFRNAIEEGNVEKYLQMVPAHKNDLFFIPPGTVHAIGAGCLVAEIQQSSNLTYRLYDYNRTDRDGNRRELHLDKGLAVANLDAMPEPRQPMRLLRYSGGTASELLCRCKYFQVERVLVNTEQRREMASFRVSPESFEVFLFLNGCGSLFCEDAMLQFFKGDCVFLPAGTADVRLHARTEFLRISC
ncbi:MAG: class I mannose-6-phosphate isomerase [Lentisphaeria bacterium]|nr:class I mannose-6-phosphate isomerase [Lentisphaeria bacterium]MBR3506638.1 class I mannose-6-phosphate isomerase [Lentisphaeria bacterium]